MSNGRDLEDAIATIALGIIGGLALVAILDALFTKRCPYCNRQIPTNSQQCPHCFTYLG